MKVCLEFDDSERGDARRAFSATAAHNALSEFREYLRRRLKYDNLPDEVAKALDEARDEFYRVIEYWHLDIDSDD